MGRVAGQQRPVIPAQFGGLSKFARPRIFCLLTTDHGMDPVHFGSGD